MKFSRQRQQILDYVKSVKTHPTAETVYRKVRDDNPNISLGTVYRNLDKLSEEGLITRIKIANQKDRFDGDVIPHSHAICEKCGKVIDVYTCNLDSIDKFVENNIHCKVLSHDIIFNVICPKCNKDGEE